MLEFIIISELNFFFSSFIYSSVSDFISVKIPEDLSLCLISPESDNKFSLVVSEISDNISEL